MFLAACGGGSSTTTSASTTEAAVAATVDHTAMPGMDMTAAGTSALSPAAQAAPPATPSGSTTPVASPVTQGGATPQASAAVKIVEPSLDYQSWTYEPNDLHVPVGTTVVWTNTGGAAHTVTSDDGTSFDSGPIPPDHQFSQLMDTAGTFPYRCTFHPFMKGTLTVTA
ncbi:MAG TPA: cupredoxin domain-containing protein [Pseudonocardiaceae bacterium]|nr:cupredoxin domain-containing protein [Pseudonocardiaceae bacterium]